MSMTTTQKGKIIKTLLKWKTWNSMTNELSEVKPPKKTTHWIWFLNNPDCLKNRCLTKAVLTSPNWFQWTPSKPRSHPIQSLSSAWISLNYHPYYDERRQNKKMPWCSPGPWYWWSSLSSYQKKKPPARGDRCCSMEGSRFLDFQSRKNSKPPRWTNYQKENQQWSLILIPATSKR